MAAQAPSGLEVLERATKPARAWGWWLGFASALGLGAAAFVLASRTPIIEDLSVVRQMQERGMLAETAVGLLVVVIAFAWLAIAALRHVVKTAAVANQQRTMLDAIVASVPDAVVVADGRGRFRANAAAVQLFGLPTDGGPWVTFYDAMVKLDRRDAPTGHRIPSGAGVLEAALKGRAAAGDEIITTPEGQRTIHVTGSPIPMAHGIWGGLILARDVTEQLAAQAALQAAKDGLQRKNAEHLQMARAIAHDLGNALTPASMHLAMLKLGRSDPMNSVSALERSVAQIHRLVGDLGDMARFESGAMTVAVKELSLPEAISSALVAFQPLAEDKKVELETAIGDARPVKADPERLGQVLSNLFSNALKFTPSGGQVQVATAPEGDLVRISVTDSGMGLEPGQISRLFRPFSQVHEPGAIKERGTGLGLYICKGLIEQHGGTMGVTSPGRGKGSTFWFTLPAATP